MPPSFYWLLGLLAIQQAIPSSNGCGELIVKQAAVKIHRDMVVSAIEKTGETISITIPSVFRKTTWKKILQCPALSDMKEAVHLDHGYHCYSGAGEGGCGTQFSGFSSEAKSRININSLYVPHQSDNGGGRCLFVQWVDHCAAVTPKREIPTMDILSLTNVECVIDYQHDSLFKKSKTGDVQITVTPKCEAMPSQYAIAIGSKIYLEETAKALAYVNNNCPIYRKSNKEPWVVNEAKWSISLKSFNEYHYVAAWEGMPAGDGLDWQTGNNDANGIFQESIEEGVIVYETRYKNCSLVDSFSTGSSDDVCDVTACELRSHLHDVSSQALKAIIGLRLKSKNKKGLVTCQLRVKDKNVVHNYFVVSTTTSLPIDVIEGTTIIDGGGITCSLVITPPQGLNEAYGHDLTYSDKSTESTLASGLSSALGFNIPSYFIFIAIGVLVVMNPNLMTIVAQPRALMLVAGLYLAYQVQPASANSDWIECSRHENISNIYFLLSMLIWGGQLFSYDWIMPLTALVFTMYQLRRKNPEFKLRFIPIVFLLAIILTGLPQPLELGRIWVMMISAAFYLFLNLRFHNWVKIQEDRIVEDFDYYQLQLRPFSYESWMTGDFDLTYITDYIKSSIRNHGGGILYLHNRFVAAIQAVEERSLSSRRLYNEAVSSKRNVANLIGTIFYEIEINPIFREMLNGLNRDQIDDLYKSHMTITGREPFDLEWLDAYQFLKTRRKKLMSSGRYSQDGLILH